LVLKIGIFQLENLLLNGLNFSLIDLTENQSLRKSLPLVEQYKERLLKVSNSEDILSQLPIQKFKNQPIVLVCDDGTLSQTIGNELINYGFDQIYMLENGIILSQHQ
jgi:rhodanese-related sulfurtransferase